MSPPSMDFLWRAALPPERLSLLLGEESANPYWETQIRLSGGEDAEVPTFYVGCGTCGLSAGAGYTVNALREALGARSVTAEVVEVGCVGFCMAEPIVDVLLPGRRRISFAHVTQECIPAFLDAVLAETVSEEIDCLGQYGSSSLAAWKKVPLLAEHPFYAAQTRRLLANCGWLDPLKIESYIARGGYRAFARAVTTRIPSEVCDEVTASLLRGRGGSGFSTGRKWNKALTTAAEQKYVICNADEGDPGAFMDRALIEGDPHRVLEGLAIAAYAVGATRAFIYIRSEYEMAVKRLEIAITQARAWGLLGYNILDSGFTLDVSVKKGAGAFVCGEETALLNSIEGKRGMPRPRPPYPAQKGLFGKPTVINNVETLANVPDILWHGAEWFRSVGTSSSGGTKLFSLAGKVVRTGVVEVPMGTPLRQVIFDIGGGIADARQFKAVQIGGPSGGCLPALHLDVAIDYESLKEIGAMMGSGGMVVLDETDCMVDVARFFMEFIQRESCGKCIPCREGTRRMLEILERITRSRRGETREDTLDRFLGVMRLGRLATSIRDTALCGLGQTAANPVLATLRYFREEYEAHVYDRRCPAGVCTDLLTFQIDPQSCRGCMVCAGKCPSGAIVGNNKTPHYIVQERCTRCGACLDACRFGAVSKE